MVAKSPKEYLELIAAQGDITGTELVKHVPRVLNDYHDFYELAALIHSGYIATDLTQSRSRRPEIYNTLGYTAMDAAIHLCQFTLHAGESIRIENAEFPSWQSAVFFSLTGSGYQHLADLHDAEEEAGQRRLDRWVAFGIAVVAAVLSSAATKLFGSC